MTNGVCNVHEPTSLVVPNLYQIKNKRSRNDFYKKNDGNKIYLHLISARVERNQSQDTSSISIKRILQIYLVNACIINLLCNTVTLNFLPKENYIQLKRNANLLIIFYCTKSALSYNKKKTSFYTSYEYVEVTRFWQMVLFAGRWEWRR